MDVPELIAEELCADLLMVVHEKIGTFRFGERAKLTTWIFEIAKNRAIDYHRRSKPDCCSLNEAIQQQDQDATVGSEYAGRNETLLVWLRSELEQLSERDQAILKWRALEIPFAQIAAWLQMTEGTVRVRHKRALDKLKVAAERDVQQGASKS